MDETIGAGKGSIKMSSEHKLAIIDALNRSAFALDTMNLTDLENGFHADAVFNLTITGNDDANVFTGRDAIMGLMKGALDAQTDVRKHNLSNFIFQTMTDNTAEVVAYLTLCATENASSRLITNGTYRDVLVLEGENWLIKERNLHLDAAY